MNMLNERIVEPLLALPRIVKRSIVLAINAGLCVLTVWMAISLRIGDFVPLYFWGWPAALVSLVVALPIFVAFGFYRAVFRYVSWEALATISQAILIYGIIYSAIFTAFSIPGVPRTVGVIQPVLLLIAVGASRALGRYVLGGRYRYGLRSRERKNILIYGAGFAGRQLSTALSDTLESHVVGFLDDDRHLHGSMIGRVRVWSPEKVAALVKRYDVSEVLLALPSVSRARRNEILKLIARPGRAVRTLPGLLDIAQGQVTVSDIRPLEIEDLLGRDAVAARRRAAGEEHPRQGGAGDRRRRLDRQRALPPDPRSSRRPALLLRRYRANMRSTPSIGSWSAPRRRPGATAPSWCRCSARSATRRGCAQIFAAWRPDTIYHAAAYKHVPLVEHNPARRACATTSFGTLVMRPARAGMRRRDFVLISTDKAVRPTNVMGASKRLAEMVLQALADDGRGDLLLDGPLRQRARLERVGRAAVPPADRAGGPVTVTHPRDHALFHDHSRGGAARHPGRRHGQGGEVFVLDMGEPVRILDLAARHDRAVGPQGPRRGQSRRRHRDRLHRPAARREAVRGVADRQRSDRDPHPRIMMAREIACASPSGDRNMDRISPGDRRADRSAGRPASCLRGAGPRI